MAFLSLRSAGPSRCRTARQLGLTRTASPSSTRWNMPEPSFTDKEGCRRRRDPRHRIWREHGLSWAGRPVKRSLVLSVRSFDVLAPAARAREGWPGPVSVTKTPGRNVITRALHVARETETIAVGTSIAYAFRPPPDPHRLGRGQRPAPHQGTGSHFFDQCPGPVPIHKALGIKFDHPAARLASTSPTSAPPSTQPRGCISTAGFYSADVAASLTPTPPLTRPASRSARSDGPGRRGRTCRTGSRCTRSPTAATSTTSCSPPSRPRKGQRRSWHAGAWPASTPTERRPAAKRAPG